MTAKFLFEPEDGDLGVIEGHVSHTAAVQSYGHYLLDVARMTANDTDEYLPLCDSEHCYQTEDKYREEWFVWHTEPNDQARPVTLIGEGVESRVYKGSAFDLMEEERRKRKELEEKYRAMTGRVVTEAERTVQTTRVGVEDNTND